jgi:hypothetical protein
MTTCGSSRWSGVFIALLILSSSSQIWGYEIETHNLLSDTSVRRSQATDVLRNQLAINQGIGLVIDGRDLATWAGIGAEREDDAGRFLNHFHNPLRDWFNAGFRSPYPGLGVQIGFSSILWQQDSERSGWSWWDTRRFYWDALTQPQLAERNERFARTFESLGHVIHLIQDAASPAHTRNDPHIGPPADAVAAGRTKRYEYETYARQVQQEQPDVFNAILSQSFTVPSNWQGLDPDPLAPIPIARLIDTDRYNGDSGSATVTLQAPIGLAEYVTANYFSEDRTFPGVNPFTRFPHPARENAAVVTVDVPLPGQAETVKRLYYLNTLDTSNPHHLATVGFLRDYFIQFQLDPGRADQKPALDELVYREYAGILVPRAVGYSTAAIDYFFRGRLDARIAFDDAIDPATGNADPALRTLVARNVSGEMLGPGTIALFVEDRETRTRTPVLKPDGSGQPLGEVVILPVLDQMPIGADPTGDPIRFRPPFAAERYVVAYRGTLGNERRTDSFIGAVIAKVVGGERAEGIVSGAKPVLRAPQGTFNLSPDADGLDKAQWGDLDNTFVGVVSLDAGNVRPDQVKAFRIVRPAGSTDIPAAVQEDGSRVATTELLKSVNFPFGVDLSTVVNWSHEKRFKQTLITWELTDTLAYIGGDPDNGGAMYQFVSKIPGTPEMETVVTQGVTLAHSFPLILDEAHLLDQPGLAPRPYGWRVTDVGLDAQDRLLAVVEVKLTSLESAFTLRQVGLRSRDVDCQMQDRSSYTLGAGFPISNVVTVLLDVETGQVLGTTGTGAIAPHTIEDEATSVLQVKSTTIFSGGPLAGAQSHCADTSYTIGNEDYATQNTATLAMPPVGVTEQTIGGWYRSELDALVSTSVQGTPTLSQNQLVYFVDSDAGVNYALTQSQPASHLTGYLTHVREGVRIRPAATANPQVMLRFARPVGISAQEGEEAVLVQWSPMSAGESRLAIPQELPASLYTLKRATPQAAMLLSDDGFGGSSTLLVELGPGTVRPPYPGDLSQNFALLAPEILYNIYDTQFYTLGLDKTALPLPLADGRTGPQPIADFHVIPIMP